MKFSWARRKESSAFFHGRDGGRKSRIGKGEITRGHEHESGIDEIVRPTDFALMEGPAAMRASKYFVAVRRENTKSSMLKNTTSVCRHPALRIQDYSSILRKKLSAPIFSLKSLEQVNGEGNLTSGLAFDTSQILIFSV